MARAAATTRKLLIVAAEEVVGEDLLAAVHERADDAAAEVRIVAPALADSALKHVAGDVDEGREEASVRLDRSCKRLAEQGIEASGEIGDADPLLAIDDQLARFPADEIILVTAAGERAHWAEGDLFERARERFEPPIVHVELERQSAGDARVVEWERSPGGEDSSREGEASGYSGNTPPLSLRDIGGIATAIIGTIILVVLAADCTGESIETWSGDAGCIVRYVLAGGMALINIAHIVGLVLFESVRYRGFWQRFFATFSLVGTPAAIVISLLVG